LIDFGACLEFENEFIMEYMNIIYYSTIELNKQKVIDSSIKMGFMTGDESQIMVDAHTESAKYIGEPFSYCGVYDFKKQKASQNVKKTIPIVNLF
jgi:aarF domain-containing kinase